MGKVGEEAVGKVVEATGEAVLEAEVVEATGEAVLGWRRR